MKPIKQLPLLATTGAMTILALSSNEKWISIVAAIVGIAALAIFVKINVKNI